MKIIQTDTSNEALITAIRANMCDFFRHLGKSTTEDHVENGKFVRWHTPLGHPWFNGVLSSDFFEENDPAFIEKSIQYFRTKGVGSFTWWMEPHLKSSDWQPALSKYGFGFSNGTPGMAVELQALRDTKEMVNGLEIRAVADEESLRIWSRIFTLGYGLPAAWEDTVHALWLKLGLDFPVRNYLGYLGGKPVSTSSVFFGGGVAGIYCVSTLPEARGKGIGAALTLHPLFEAREMGYAIGVLQSSEMGFNVYKRLGFRHLCQIENFYLVLK